MAARLAVVGDQQAGAGADAPLLHALDVSRADAAGEKGVFAEVLEVAPAERRAHEVQHRRQQHVLVERQHFLREHAPEFARRRLVPRAGERERTGQQGRARALLVAHGPQPLPAIEHGQLANAQPRHSAREERAVAEGDLLLQGQASQQVGDSLFQQGLRIL